MNLFSTHHTCLCPPSPHTNYQAPNHQNTQFLHVYCFEHPPAFLSNFLNVHMRLSNFLQVFFLPCCDHFFLMFQQTHTHIHLLYVWRSGKVGGGVMCTHELTLIKIKGQPQSQVPSVLLFCLFCLETESN